MKLRKYIPLLVLLMILTGCRHEEPEPEIVYDYDYIDYLDIEFVGPDGYASMDINIADFNAADFKSESDYIKMKKIINSLYDDVVASKYDEISNNDVIQIGVATTFDISELGDMSVNLGTHSITVSNLRPPKEMDLFAPENVVFYGLEGTKKVFYYFPTGSAFSNEVKENIKYIISIDDDTIEKNKTVLTLEADMSPALLNSQRKYGTIKRYFGSNGYVIEPVAERTLKMTVNEDALETLNKSVVRKEMEDRIRENGEIDGYVFKQVMSIQKTDIPYEYYIVALYSQVDGDRNLYVKYSSNMAYVNNEIIVYQFDRESTTDAKYATDAYGNARILYRYELFEVVEEEVPEEETPENNG